MERASAEPLRSRNGRRLNFIGLGAATGRSHRRTGHEKEMIELAPVTVRPHNELKSSNGVPQNVGTRHVNVNSTEQKTSE